MHEHELVPRAAAGDVAAFELFFQNFYDFAVNKVRRLAHSAREFELSEDATQIAFMQLWAGQWRRTDAADPRGILLSRVRDAFRTLRWYERRSRHEPLPEGDDGIGAWMLRSPEPSIEDELIERDEIARLRAAVAALSPRDQELVQLRYATEPAALSIGEIAARLGRHRTGVAVRLGRIRRALAVAMGGEYRGHRDRSYIGRHLHNATLEAQNKARSARRRHRQEKLGERHEN